MADRVFFHIGAPKTGTTFLQHVMSKNRAGLERQGVRYASGEYAADRVWATEVLRGVDHSNHPKPHAAGAWRRILQQVREWDGAAVISHEFFGACSAAQAERALADLEPAEVHLVFTARDYVRQAAAVWQERLKYAHSTPQREFRLDPAQNRTPMWSWQTQDIPAILQRWRHDLPADRVHVVTVPRHESPGDGLWERYASVIGIDPASCDTEVARGNQSLGVVEAELLRRVNERLDSELSRPFVAARWVRDVLADRILASRQGARFSLDAGHLQLLDERARRAVVELEEAGYDVVGDLDDLLPRHGAGDLRRPEDVDDSELLDAATDTIAALLAYLRERETKPSNAARQAPGAKASNVRQQAATAGRARSLRSRARRAVRRTKRVAQHYPGATD